MPGEIKNKIGQRPPQKSKRSEAEQQRIKELLEVGRKQPFWQYLIQRIDEMIESDRRAVETIIPAGADAGKLAQAQGRLQALQHLRNLPEIELGIYDPTKDPSSSTEDPENG